MQVQTFEIDRHEVTTQQFLACRKAGACGTEGPSGSTTRNPRSPLIERCTTTLDALQGPPKEGKGSHPMNCVAHWEATAYCKWVGKRLPTDIEWEFAARSRNAEQVCPWGGTYPDQVNCDRSKRKPSQGPPAVCATPKDNTAQGVCDMAGGVPSEYVTMQDLSARPDECEWQAASRTGRLPFESNHSCGPEPRHYTRSPSIGFRCARAAQ